jgi:predicted NAD/FAD-binding protein
MKRRKPATAASRTIDEGANRVVKALRDARHGRVDANDPLMEQLRQCPEAFKVGEILGKAFDSLKYAQDGGEIGDRYLPPAGVVLPPLVWSAFH